jgi:uncharacterized RDD family membrane protein YckC
MGKSRPIKIRIYARAVVALLLIALWSLAALSGLVLWLAPSGSHSGTQSLLLGLTKVEWTDVHFWIAVAAFVVTVVHIIIEWKVLRGLVRYLTSTHRKGEPLTHNL